jgi:hypothetical protein
MADEATELPQILAKTAGIIENSLLEGQIKDQTLSLA